MKKIFFVILFLFLFSKNVYSQETDRINNFSAEIVIEKDTSINIKEKIEYETSKNKHGILRYIPISYTRNGLNYSAKVKNINVWDFETEETIPNSVSFEGGKAVIKIGDPDKTFSGKKTYLLSYEVENALKRYENYDELYWDIVGEGWQIPVLKSGAKVISDYAKVNSAVCYSGTYGANDNLCNFSYDKNQAEFSYDKTIDYNKNMTVAISLSQEGSEIVFPTKMEMFVKGVKDNFWLFLIALPAVLMWIFWFLWGRDYMFLSKNVFISNSEKPKKLRPLFYKHRTPMVYQPLKDLTAGEAGAILDERVDNQDIVAEIIDLARKKFMKIERIETKKLFGKKEDYKFIKLKEASKSLPKQQEYLFEKIFKDEDEIKLSKLKGSFYTYMEKSRQYINESLKSKNLYTVNPTTRRAIFIFLAIVFNILGFFVTAAFSEMIYSPLPFLVFLPTLIVSLIIAIQMPQKTAQGTNFMLQAKGLQHTIRLGAWREKIKEKNLFIEEVLPFAISLGVIKELAKDMEKLNIKPPSYFEGSTIYNLGTYSFVNSFAQQANSNLSYNPSSRSWSGGSGSSGGGFSGGGGGGGGGGSW